MKINDVHNISSIYNTNTNEKFLIMFENNTNKWGAMDRPIRVCTQVKIYTHVLNILHDSEEVLYPTYKPYTPDEKDLFAEK